MSKVNFYSAQNLKYEVLLMNTKCNIYYRSPQLCCLVYFVGWQGILISLVGWDNYPTKNCSIVLGECLGFSFFTWKYANTYYSRESRYDQIT